MNELDAFVSTLIDSAESYDRDPTPWLAFADFLGDRDHPAAGVYQAWVEGVRPAAEAALFVDRVVPRPDLKTHIAAHAEYAEALAALDDRNLILLSASIIRASVLQRADFAPIALPAMRLSARVELRTLLGISPGDTPEDQAVRSVEEACGREDECGELATLVCQVYRDSIPAVMAPRALRWYLHSVTQAQGLENGITEAARHIVALSGAPTPSPPGNGFSPCYVCYHPTVAPRDGTGHICSVCGYEIGVDSPGEYRRELYCCIELGHVHPRPQYTYPFRVSGEAFDLAVELGMIGIDQNEETVWYADDWRAEVTRMLASTPVRRT